MRLATFRDGAGTRIGVVRDGDMVDRARAATLTGEEPPLELRDMLALIDGGASALGRARALLEGMPAQAALPLRDVELLAPIPRPRKNVFCLGRNYAEHSAASLRAIRQEMQLPAYPNVFTKAVTSVNGPFADIPYDARVSEQLDWEGELAVILGRAARHIPREDALAHLLGYSVLNDLTPPDLQNLT